MSPDALRGAFVIATALAASPGLAIAGNPSPIQSLHYESGGRKVAVDIVRPAQAGRLPGVLILHGRGGLSLYGAALMRLAHSLSARGFVVLIPHYFDASSSPDAPEVTPASFETWRKAVQDALTFAAKRPDIDAKRIGVVGVSLGGFLAGAEAVQDDRVAALVSESAGVSTWFPSTPIRMPPLLIVYSREDGTVPLSEAIHLGEIARRLHVEPEIALYEGSEHLLTGSSALSAEHRIVAFLTKTLRAETH